MKHLRRATITGRPTSRDAVHATVNDASTLCGWSFLAQGMFEGKAISMAMETKDPISCHRCMVKVRLAITNRLHTLSADGQEEILTMIEDGLIK